MFYLKDGIKFGIIINGSGFQYGIIENEEIFIEKIRTFRFSRKVRILYFGGDGKTRTYDLMHVKHAL